MTETFDQGWAARPFKQQFPELTESTAEYLDRVNYSITMMLVSDMITDSQAENIRTKRFPRLVSEKVLEARGKNEIALTDQEVSRIKRSAGRDKEIKS